MIISDETRLTFAIVDLIISEGLFFNISQKPWFKKVLDLARNVSKWHNLPNTKIIYKYILDVINDQNIKNNLNMINKEVYVFGTTVFRTPLLKILFSGKNISVVVL